MVVAQPGWMAMAAAALDVLIPLCCGEHLAEHDHAERNVRRPKDALFA
jgi:hypothetical protein